MLFKGPLSAKGSVGGGGPSGAWYLAEGWTLMPHVASQVSEPHREEGGGSRPRAAQLSLERHAGATGSSFQPGVAQMALLCSCNTQRRQAGVLTSLDHTSSVPNPARPVPMSICQQVLSSVHQLPRCLDSTCKQSNCSGSFKI